MKEWKNYSQLLPVSVWLLFSLLSLWGATIGESNGNTTTVLVLTPYHYVGFGVLLVLLGTFFFLRKYYKYVVITALLLGAFNLAAFSGNNLVITIGKNGGLEIQPLSLLVGFMFLVINFDTIRKKVLDWSDELDHEKAPYTRDELSAFCQKYASFSKEELYQIRSDLRYTPVARRAAEEVLKSRIEKGNTD